MRLHARNLRRTTRAEPAQNADAHNARKRRENVDAQNPRVLLILLVVVVVVVVVVAVAVVVVAVAVGVAVAVAAAAAAGGGVVVVIIISYSSPISACQNRHMPNVWLLCWTEANRATRSRTKQLAPENHSFPSYLLYETIGCSVWRRRTEQLSPHLSGEIC